MTYMVEWGDTLIADDHRTLSLMARDYPDAVRPPGCGKCRSCVSAPFSFDRVNKAPWFHVDNPATADFYGAIVSDMQGAMDRTTDARLSQGLDDGGWITGLREGPREVRVKMVLYAQSESGLNAGQAWLSGVVTRADRTACGKGAVMTFGVACPGEASQLGFEVASTDPALRQHTDRQLVSCVVTSGPEVVRTSSVRGLWAREMEMGVVSERGTIMRPVVEHVDAAGGTVADGVVVETVSSVPGPCPPPTDVQVMRDPSTVIPVPPVVQGPGTDPEDLTETFTHKQRVTVSGASEPWVRRSVRVSLRADAGDVSSARVRFFPLSDYTDCGEVGEFYVRYVQDGWNLVIDGVENNIFAWSGDESNVAQASHLIRSMYANAAFSYPTLPTGEGFYMTVESNGSVEVSVESAVVE